MLSFLSFLQHTDFYLSADRPSSINHSQSNFPTYELAAMAGPAAINHDHEKTTLRAGITATLRHDSFLSPPSILARATSLDNILEYREKVALNKSVLSLQLPNSGGDTEDSTPSTSKRSSVIQKVSTVPARQFRCRAAEFGFVFAMAMAQLLGVRVLVRSA